MSFAERLPKGKFITILVLSFLTFMGFNIYLGILYENTGYPVPLIEGQTRFDAQVLKSDFMVLIEKETMGDYILIQYLDLGIMISTAVFFSMLAYFIFRQLASPNWKRKGFIFSLFFPLSSLLDFIENIFLLAMVYNLHDFPSWLAFAYSGSAVLKLLAFGIGVLSLLIIPILAKLSSKNQQR
ncbi:MAG: hypothetical protein ACW98W_20495 [Candidatus Hodarchaeales archaeon]